ncbi:hypothetical protein FKM82_003832 [Ascaphus truei]
MERNKVESDYDALQERLGTLPDKLSYDVMVPFGPLAFMPGKLVQTNEVTVLLGDNWFAKCSTKQAIGLVDHRKKHVRKALDDLQEVVKNFESRTEFTADLQKMSDEAGEYLDIREEAENDETIVTKGKRRTAHRPHSKPKAADLFEMDLQEAETKDLFFVDDELWVRLEELEREEELRGELDEIPHASQEDLCSSEEDKENRKTDLNVKKGAIGLRTQGNIPNTNTEAMLNTSQVNGSTSHHSEDEYDSGTSKNVVATIHFSHTVEPKRVRINTGKNTTLKYSEKKEEAKRKRKNSNGNGHSVPNIKTPADIYRVFVDLVNGEYVPRKSIMKSRSREDSVCSDTSESSVADMDDRPGYLRSFSCEENIFSDPGEGVLEEEDRQHKKLSPVFGPFEAFSGTVVEKEPFSFSVPIPSIAHSALPTIPERKSEEMFPEIPEENTKRVSKFKAARIQLKN